MERRGLGLRVKLGWALAIVVERGDDGRPRVVGRDELRFSAADGAFAYHAAMEADPAERASIIDDADRRAADAATHLLADALAEHAATDVGIIVGRGVRKIPLERIVASSQLFHTAEAELLQGAFIEAARRLDASCVPVTFGDAEAHEDWGQIAALARQAGRPWQKDHKLAATAAWVALADVTDS